MDSEYHLLTTDIMGNSEGSGVLVNLDGKIVGVIAQSFSGEADTGVVTALSISDLRKLIEQLSNNEDLIYLGVRGQDISSSLAQKTGIPTGIYVNSVEEDSPAMNAGIQNGDVIVKVGNEVSRRCRDCEHAWISRKGSEDQSDGDAKRCGRICGNSV